VYICTMRTQSSAMTRKSAPGSRESAALPSSAWWRLPASRHGALGHHDRYRGRDGRARARHAREILNASRYASI